MSGWKMRCVRSDGEERSLLSKHGTGGNALPQRAICMSQVIKAYYKQIFNGFAEVNLQRKIEKLLRFRLIFARHFAVRETLRGCMTLKQMWHLWDNNLMSVKLNLHCLMRWLRLHASLIQRRSKCWVGGRKEMCAVLFIHAASFPPTSAAQHAQEGKTRNGRKSISNCFSLFNNETRRAEKDFH